MNSQLISYSVIGKKLLPITPRRMQELDRLSQTGFGINSLILMENAGRSAAEVILSLLNGRKENVICVCGRGNNGGDGLVCARHLISRGIKVKIFMLTGKKTLKGDVRTNENILKKMGYRIRLLGVPKDLVQLKQNLGKCHLVIDAIFGIGFKGEMRAPQSEIVELINQSKKPIVSLDVPSGLDALSGKVKGSCVKAHTTVTFGFPKIGLVRNNGPFYAGKVVVTDISLPGNFYTR